MSNIGNIAIKGVKNLVFRDKTSHEVVGDIKYLVDVSLSDELASDFLRGGYNNPKLLTIYGDRETTFTGNSATISPELLKIMTSTEIVNKEVEEDFVEELIHASNILTLEKTPISAYLEVYPLDQHGKKGTKLATTDFTVSTNKITLNTPTSERYVVYYRSKVQVATIETKDVTPRTYDASALVVFTEIESKELKQGWIRIPSASVQPKYSIAGKNEASAPDAIEITIDCLMDSVYGYPYAIDIMA